MALLDRVAVFVGILQGTAAVYDGAVQRRRQSEQDEHERRRETDKDQRVVDLEERIAKLEAKA